LEDVGHGGGVQMAGVEEAEVMTEAEVMNQEVMNQEALAKEAFHGNRQYPRIHRGDPRGR